MPDVTAIDGGADVEEVEDIVESKRGWEMNVMGFECGDGRSCCDLKDRQYRCSGVSGEGPGGFLSCWRGLMGAAIMMGDRPLQIRRKTMQW